MRKGVSLALLFGLIATAIAGTRTAAAQQPAPSRPGQVDISLTYTTSHSNFVPGDSFWMQGGDVEVAYHLPARFAGVASFSGGHTGRGRRSAQPDYHGLRPALHMDASPVKAGGCDLRTGAGRHFRGIGQHVSSCWSVHHQRIQPCHSSRRRRQHWSLSALGHPRRRGTVAAHRATELDHQRAEQRQNRRRHRGPISGHSITPAPLG